MASLGGDLRGKVGDIRRRLPWMIGGWYLRAQARRLRKPAQLTRLNEEGAQSAPLVDVTLRARSPGPKAKSPAALNGLLINDTGQAGNYTELPTRSRKF
jgi:hypothetical protein